MRIFIVEDEILPAIMLEAELQKAGWETVGPFATLTDARQAGRSETLDIAVLDINLGGEMVYPLAQDLADRGIPFLFLTGYSSRDLPEAFRDFPRVSKPYDPPLLLRELERHVKR